jgi:hypothetical protein
VPIAFISSTVVDLRDLRSALKFWLEEFGFDVRTSEASDFPRPLDRDAAAAALATIEGSDYYILIIGERRGSLFPGGDISVTHAELLEARRLFSSTQRPQLLTFVRSSVEQLVRVGVRPNSISEQDWDGVSRILQSAREPNQPNWINAFETFRDITDVLRATLKLTGPLRRKALAANLLEEIRLNTATMIHKESPTGGLWPPPRFMEPDKVPRIKADDLQGDMVLTRDEASNVLEYNLETIGAPERIVTIALDAAIQSGEFLEFQPASGALSVGPFQAALSRLREHIARLRSLQKLLDKQQAQLNRLNLRNHATDSFSVDGMFIALLQSHANIYLNILIMNGAIARFISGTESTFSMPALRHYSPRPDVAASIEATRLNDHDVDVSLGLTVPPPGASSIG